MSSTLSWVSAYFTLNLTLTLYNKLVLTHFPFPYTLTALHALCGSLGSFVLLGERPPTPSTIRERVVLLLFSMLYTLNIVVSNASLRLVTLPFHQCVRASAPAFVLLIQYAPSLLPLPTAASLRLPSSRRRPSTRKLLTLIPVILGVALATYGDYYFTTTGFLLTLLGTFLAALKTVVTNVLVRRRASPPRGCADAHDPYDADVSINLNDKRYGIDSGKGAHYGDNDTKHSLPSHSNFRFPLPSPAGPSGIAISHSRVQNSSGSSSSSSLSHGDRHPYTHKPRPLSLSAFSSDGAPSIPNTLSFNLSSSLPSSYGLRIPNYPLTRTSRPQSACSAPPSPHVQSTNLGRACDDRGKNASSTATTRPTTVSTRSIRAHDEIDIDIEKFSHTPCTPHPHFHSHSPRRPSFQSKLNLPTLVRTVYSQLGPPLTLTPLQLLSLLSPLAFVQCVALAWATGELDRVNVHLHSSHLPSSHHTSPYSHHSSVMMPSWLGQWTTLPGVGFLGRRIPSALEQGVEWGGGTQVPWLLANAVLAFALNVVSFGANKRVGAVGMSVAANTKQALTLLLSIALFDLALGPMNVLGIVCALAGGAGYAWVEGRGL